MSTPYAGSLCPLCCGRRVPGRITSMSDLGTCLVVVRNVPATVCDQCGEEWVDHATANALYQLGEDARTRGAVVEVLRMAS